MLIIGLSIPRVRISLPCRTLSGPLSDGGHGMTCGYGFEVKQNRLWFLGKQAKQDGIFSYSQRSVCNFLPAESSDYQQA